MSAFVVAPRSRVAVYGAEELKQVAHRYGFFALSISVLIHFSLITLYYLCVLFQREQTHPYAPDHRGPVIVDTRPQIPGVYELPPKPGSPAVNKLMGDEGVPVPVADASVSLEKTIPSQSDLADLFDPHGGDLPTGEAINPPVETMDDKPLPIWTPLEKKPEIVKSVVPVYPELALKSGLEGMVFVKIWVDRQGKVRDVVILKSDYDIFNESVIEAARQFVFTPAYMNNGAVAVWVAFPFSFKLKNR